MRFIDLVNSAQDPLVCTIHRLFSGQMSITVPWTVTDNIFTCFSIKKKKNAKRHTRAFFIRIQMPSKPTFGLHWNYLSACVWFFCGSHVLFKGIASTDFSKFNFKTESHDTIHTFKIISLQCFQFSAIRICLDTAYY